MSKIIGWIPIFGKEEPSNDGCGCLFLIFIIIVFMNDLGCFNRSFWRSSGGQSLELAPSAEQRDN